jgi:EmrB/QacA subfamily drug resistance transporter
VHANHKVVHDNTERTSEVVRSRSDTAGGRAVLAASFVAMFMVTLDAVAVNVAVPAIQEDLGGGMTDLQWVIDGYTLMFAALLLSSGAIADRIGARRAFVIGLAGFAAASAACAAAPSMATLVIARFVQGAAAAVMTPSSMALLGQTFPDPRRRARAVSFWAMGGALASTSGPVLSGLLTTWNWRLIFLINVPVGLAAMMVLRRAAPSARRQVPFDWVGQVTAVLAMGGFMFGVIEGGAKGFTTPAVLAAFAVALVAAAVFLIAQDRGRHPMMPLDLFRSRTVNVTVAAGFAFMICYYGLPFVMSLYLQQIRDLSALATGLAFLPMMLIGAAFTPFNGRLIDRFGARSLITAGLLLMSVGLLILGLTPVAAPVWLLSALMMLVGLGGPAVMPPATTALLGAVSPEQAGTASGVLNTGRQLGGALAVAVFGALLAQPSYFGSGMRISLLAAGLIALITALISSHYLRTPSTRTPRRSR